jgi:hypothetical protein
MRKWSRNSYRALLLLSILAAIICLDVIIALLPVIIPNAATGERQAISDALGEHAGQLLILFVAFGMAAITLRQSGEPVLDPDEEDKP